MAHTLLFGFDEKLSRWACDRIPWADYHSSMRAVGVADGDDASAQLMAVCIYHNFIPIKMIDGKPYYGLCEIALATNGARWATRRTISNLLRIPFLQYNCRKIVTVVPSSNFRALKFNKGIGLKPEGTLRHHFAKNVHACVHGMMRSEFEARWKEPKPQRPTGLQGIAKTDTLSAASA